MITRDPRLQTIIANQAYPLLFATISGAHLYGFPSPDSDYDLRGAHILPARNVVGLKPGPDTWTFEEIVDGLELDLVTHDIKKFFELLLRKNGYVLEQLTSPLVVQTSDAHAEVCALVPQLVTRYHSYHYLGFAATQWQLFFKEQPRRVKPLLYVYRVLLTGLYLMHTGRIEANLVHLNQEFRLSYLPELIAQKLAGPELGTLDDADIAFHEREYLRLRAELETAHRTSQLPETPSAQPALDDLLIRLRLASVNE